MKTYEDMAAQPLRAGSRVAVVQTSHPRWNFITAVCADDELYGGQAPSDADVLLVEALHESYTTYWYDGGTSRWFREMRAEHPLDVDGGANGVTLLKRADDDWAYRRRTWTGGGPTFYPQPRSGIGQKMTLRELLDHINGGIDTYGTAYWRKYKAAHPDLFPLTAATVDQAVQL